MSNSSTIRQFIDLNLPDNTSQLITPAIMRNMFNQVVDYVEAGGNNLEILSLNADATVATAANKLIMFIAIKPTSPIAVLKIGTTAGNSEVYEMNDVPAGQWTLIELNYMPIAAGNIYLTGIPPVTDVRIFKS